MLKSEQLSALRFVSNPELNAVVNAIDSWCALPGRASCPVTGGGGADRDRTDDPLLAKQVLSQLSYSPGVSEVRQQKTDAPAPSPAAHNAPI